MDVLEYMEAHGHEQLSVFSDREAGLRAFIAIHDTTLGPAVGGVRIWPHKTEDDAILDVLRLARGMTYKSAAAGLNMGGGKALIMASPQDKSESMMRGFGRFVESLGGRYVTTEDAGATVRDLEYVAQETNHVVGLPVSQGGSGDPSVMTAHGVHRGHAGMRPGRVGSRVPGGAHNRPAGLRQGGLSACRAPHGGRRPAHRR